MGDDTAKEEENSDDHHLLEMNDIIEPLAETWLSKWLRAREYFGPNRERLFPVETRNHLGRGVRR